MYNMNVLAAGALVSFAAAVPMQGHQHHERAIKWVTETAADVVTVPVTRTVWLNPGESAPTGGPSQPVGTGSSSFATSSGLFPTGSSESGASSPSTSAGSFPTESSASSAFSSPSGEPGSSIQSTVLTSSTSVAAPVPTTSSASSAWVPSSTVATTSSAAAPTSSTGSSSGGNSGSGEITYYAPGMGSCGITNSATDLIVAMPHGIMEAQGATNPNANPLCGQSITLTKGSVSVTAKITDTCPGCDDNHVDCSPAVFDKFGAEALGVISGISWSY